MFAARILRQAVTKTSTGIVGLEVDPNGRKNLIDMSKRVLERVQIIPAHTAYRKTVETIYGYRLKVAQDVEDEEKIEDEINLGQLEELIDMCHDELKVIDTYYAYRTWEAVELLQTQREKGEEVDEFDEGFDTAKEPNMK